MPKLDLDAIKGKAGSTFNGFTRGQKTMLFLAIGAVLVGGYLFTKWSSAPSYTALYSNLAAKDAAEVTSQLGTKGIAYKLADGGATILVPRSAVYQLRIDLSSQGLPSTGQPGYALLDKQGITTSEFRQRVDYQRALEGELANTIGAINGVAGATVHLVIPKDDLFSRDASKPTASVLVQQTAGASVPSSQVQGIVHLVAASVEGLDPADVTVTDGNGRVLSSGDEGFAAGDARIEQTAGFEGQLASSIEDLLVPLVGEGRAVVKVNAAMDFDKKQTTSETFGTKDPPIVVSESTTAEAYTGTDPDAATGVLGPEGGPTNTGTGGDYANESADRQFAVDKVTEQIETAPGQLSRLNVAVLLDAEAADVDVAAIEDMVAAAAGIDANRGDTVEVTSMAFDTSAADAAQDAIKDEAAAERQNQLLAMARTFGSVLLVALILFFAFRSARKATVHRLPMALPMPAIGSGDDDVLDIELPDSQELSMLDLAPLPPVKQLVPASLVDLIDNQPDDVAQMLRTWMTDRK